MMTDRVFEGFLNEQLRKGMELSEASDIFSLVPLAGDPSTKFLMEFRSPTLVRVDGEVLEAEQSVIGLTFNRQHLRRPIDSAHLLSLIHPREIYHPNVRFPFICLGSVEPGIGIVEIAYRTYEVLSFQNVTSLEYDALNKEACSFSRNHASRFPLDTRPLKRSNSVEAASDDRRGADIELDGEILC